METILATARKTIENEGNAILGLLAQLTEDFEKTVKFLHENKGRIIVTGIGKSAIIAQKIVATLNSTGSPAIFMHAADAIHGDLGIVQPYDAVICISKSGNTPEIKTLIPLVHSRKNTLIAITSNEQSYLGKNAHYKLLCAIDKEACPNNLAPTTSTTAQLVIGDALAIALLNQKNFSAEDFAQHHPGGSLGKQLYLKVGDVSAENAKPMISLESNLSEVIVEITSKRMGITAVIDQDKIMGVITDGDIRRMLEKHSNIANIKAKDIMSISPKTIEKEALATNAHQIMIKHKISQLLVVDNEEYIGAIHIHDLIREGIH